MPSLTIDDQDKLPFDVDQVVDMLEEAVADYGDDWYDPNSRDKTTQCRNVYELDGTEKHCIVGYVFVHNFDLIEDGSWFIENGCVGYSSIETSSIIALYYPDLVDGMIFTEKAQTVLDSAQRLQDSGFTWGNVLKHIKDSLDLLEKEDWIRDYNKRITVLVNDKTLSFA